MELQMDTRRPTLATPVVGVAASVGLALSALALPAQAQDANPNAGPNVAGASQWVPGRLLVQPRPGLSEIESDRFLNNKGGLPVTSSGNAGAGPAVAPSDTLRALSATTSSGATTSRSIHGSYADVAAPGAGIRKTDKGDACGSVSINSFASNTRMPYAFSWDRTKARTVRPRIAQTLAMRPEIGRRVWPV
jgi:hypothetical protein